MTDIDATVAAFMTNERPFGQVLADWAMTPLNAQFAAAERELAEFRALTMPCGPALSSASPIEPVPVSPLPRINRYRNGETL